MCLLLMQTKLTDSWTQLLQVCRTAVLSGRTRHTSASPYLSVSPAHAPLAVLAEWSQRRGGGKLSTEDRHHHPRNKN